MISGKQVKVVRHRLGLSLREASAISGVSWRTWARYEASAILSRRQELRVQQVLWHGARQRSFQDVCPHCCGAGLVPKEGAPSPLPRVVPLLRES
jgi:hypothetical protein